MSCLGGLFALCEAASSVAPTNNNSSSNANNVRPPSPVRSGSASLACLSLTSSAASRIPIKKRPKFQVKLEEETTSRSSGASSSCEMAMADQRYAADSQVSQSQVPCQSQSQVPCRPSSKKRKTEQSVKQPNKKKKKPKRNKDKKLKQLSSTSTSTSTSSTDSITPISADSIASRSRANSASSSASASAMLSRTVTPSSDSSSSNGSRRSSNASSIAYTAPPVSSSSSGPSAAATAKWMAEQNVFASIGFHCQANMSPAQSSHMSPTKMPSPQKKSKQRKLRTKKVSDRMLFARAAAAAKGNHGKNGGIHNPLLFTAEQQAAIAKVSSPSDAEVTSVTQNVVSAAIDALRWDGTLSTAAGRSRSTSPNSPTNHLHAPPPQQPPQPLQQRPHNKKQESMTIMIDSVVQGEQRLAKLKEDLEILHRHQMLLETTGTSSNSRVAMTMKPQHHQLQQSQPCYSPPSLNASSFNNNPTHVNPTHANAASIPAPAAPVSPTSSSRLLDVLTERFLERSVSRHNTHRRYRSSPTAAAATSASSTSCVR